MYRVLGEWAAVHSRRVVLHRRSWHAVLCTVQPFSQKPRTPTVAPLSQIGLCDPVKADLSEWCDSWRARFLQKRLYVYRAAIGHGRNFPWTSVYGTYQHAHGVTHITFFFLQCTRGSTCGWPRVHTFSGGTQCIDHCCGSFGHDSVRNMRPALSVAFLVCSMSAAVIRTPYVAFRRMSGSVASE